MKISRILILILIPLFWGMGVLSSEAGTAGFLKKNFICMVNDKYMGKEQIPVPVDGKTYYGCCKGCVATITNNQHVRFGQDPVSGNKVDKVDAFVTLDPDKHEGEVLYFESEENYRTYVTQF